MPFICSKFLLLGPDPPPPPIFKSRFTFFGALFQEGNARMTKTILAVFGLPEAVIRNKTLLWYFEIRWSININRGNDFSN